MRDADGNGGVLPGIGCLDKGQQAPDADHARPAVRYERERHARERQEIRHAEHVQDRLRDHDRHSRAGADGIKAASARGCGTHDEAGENHNTCDHQNRHNKPPFLRNEGEDQIGV